MSSTNAVKLDHNIQTLLPPLSEQELRQLETNLLSKKGRVTLTVWDETGVLLDGHHRYALCQKHSIPYKVDRISLPDKHAAQAWVISYQLGRRNLSADWGRSILGRGVFLGASSRAS
jgi:hypothetical protein